MSNYVGKIKERITVQVSLKCEFNYEKPSFSGWGYDNHTIYIMEDAEGNVFKWDTTSALGIDSFDGEFHVFKGVNRNDKFTMKATIKDHKEYKGTPQTVVNRVKVISIDEVAETYEEKVERINKEKMDSLQEGDRIIRMPYKQYKEHYDDCETFMNSYDDKFGTIKVIIRKGRMKNSGVRGEHFSRFRFTNGAVYKAVCYENAENRFKKDYPNVIPEIENIWECRKGY